MGWSAVGSCPTSRSNRNPQKRHGPNLENAAENDGRAFEAVIMIMMVMVMVMVMVRVKMFNSGSSNNPALQQPYLSEHVRLPQAPAPNHGQIPRLSHISSIARP